MLACRCEHRTRSDADHTTQWSAHWRRPASRQTSSPTIGVIINIGCGVLFGFGEFFWAGIVLIVANLFDMLDGNVARFSGHVTRYGGFLDSSLDRLSDMGCFIGIMMFYARLTAQHSILNVFLARRRNDHVGDGELYDRARARPGRKSERRISAAARTCRAADHRSTLDMELEVAELFREPHAAGVVGARGRFGVDVYTANDLYPDVSCGWLDQ